MRACQGLTGYVLGLVHREAAKATARGQVCHAALNMRENTVRRNAFNAAVTA